MQVRIEHEKFFGCTVFVNDGKKETEYRIYVGSLYVTIYTGLDDTRFSELVFVAVGI